MSDLFERMLSYARDTETIRCPPRPARKISTRRTLTESGRRYYQRCAADGISADASFARSPDTHPDRRFQATFLLLSPALARGRVLLFRACTRSGAGSTLLSA